jgi:hypothetical protein
VYITHYGLIANVSPAFKRSSTANPLLHVARSPSDIDLNSLGDA